MPPEHHPAPDPALDCQRQRQPQHQQQQQQHQQQLLTLHWRRTRRLSLTLLALWLCTCFGTVFFARELARISLFGWPLSFYMAAQGAALVCLAIIGFYAWCMRRYDRAYTRAREARQ